MDWTKRSDLALNDRFTTAKGSFVVVGVKFKKQKRIGCTVVNAANYTRYTLGKTEPLFIDEQTLLENEKTGNLQNLGQYNPKGRRGI